VTKEDHAALTARLNNITTAFHPATQYALFETAIYECVDKKFSMNIVKLMRAESRMALRPFVVKFW